MPSFTLLSKTFASTLLFCHICHSLYGIGGSRGGFRGERWWKDGQGMQEMEKTGKDGHWTVISALGLGNTDGGFLGEL